MVDIIVSDTKRPVPDMGHDVSPTPSDPLVTLQSYVEQSREKAGTALGLVVVTNETLPLILQPGARSILARPGDTWQQRIFQEGRVRVQAFLGIGVLDHLYERAKATKGFDDAACRAAYLAGMASPAHTGAEIRLVPDEYATWLGDVAFLGQYVRGDFPQGLLVEDKISGRLAYRDDGEQQAAIVDGLGNDAALSSEATSFVLAAATSALLNREWPAFRRDLPALMRAKS